MAAPGVSCRVFFRTLKTLRRNRSALNTVQEFTNRTTNGSSEISLNNDSLIRRLHSRPSSFQLTCYHKHCDNQHNHDRHHRHQCHIPSRLATSGSSISFSTKSNAWHLVPSSRTLTTSPLYFSKVTPSSMADIDPYTLVESDMKDLAPDICKVLEIDVPKLEYMTQYYFGRGKAFRPMVCLLMAKVCNNHLNTGEIVLESQRNVAMVAEMLHTASLVHDDVIDAADERRGLESLNKKYGQRQSILAGNYILSKATMLLAQIGNPQIISILSTVIEDIISGEFMQLGSKEDENERFQHYLKKTYKKTASLIANTCKAVAVMSDVEETLVEAAYEYGRNLGMSFQLVDDVLDFVASQQAMGKPTDADLKLGLANAPVLFAAMEHKELQPMIMRRFSEEGDVEYARAMVEKTDGVKQTMMLATRHSEEAVKTLSKFSSCSAREALARVSQILLQREK
ncbi:decaprenyl-diphosphate synthase subunit 1 [Elysia marginata]|uniref:Decaprenyl-diphosphate synthase subunit 1 n=1 Tax=Elysia marginata TaxID=1093978 RepID=A0AAV4I8N0_9GAST|nr:decaprenyl-diphosphate synthase subunit 1 [Elysia marginata]